MEVSNMTKEAITLDSGKEGNTGEMEADTGHLEVAILVTL